MIGLRLKSALVGAAAVLVAMGLAGLAVVEFGLFDARASTPHDPLFAWAIHTAMINAVARQSAGVTPPASVTTQQVEAGFRLYDSNCSGCHGGPAVPRTAWTDGMNPSPPYLLDASRHWSRRELYWIVDNGIKMTAMPAWRSTLSDEQVWQVVGFLVALPYLSADDYARMRAKAATPTPTPAG